MPASIFELVGLAKFTKANVHELGWHEAACCLRPLPRTESPRFMDEPLAALDAMTREQLYADIQRIWEKKRKTIILVTHNVREAVCLADRVILISPRPGRIVEECLILPARATLTAPSSLVTPRALPRRSRGTWKGPNETSSHCGRLCCPYRGVVRGHSEWPLVTRSAPAPQAVGEYLWTALRDGSILDATAVTLRRLLIGYAIGVAIGLPLGLLCSSSEFFEDTVGTLALGLQTLPSVLGPARAHLVRPD